MIDNYRTHKNSILKGAVGAISFRMLLLLLFTTIAVLPVLINISLNLPWVIKILEKSIEERQIAQLKEKFFAINREIVKRSESARLFAELSGVRELAAGDRVGVMSDDVIRQRLSYTMKKWFQGNDDILGIAIIDLQGRELFRMDREASQGLVEVPPERYGKNEDLLKELLKIGLKTPNITLITFEDRIKRLDSTHHAHCLDVTIGKLIDDYMEQGKVVGIAVIKVDLTDILKRFQYDFIITGNGDFVYSGGFQTGEHSHDPAMAFRRFPGLKELVRSGKAGVLQDQDGSRVVWAPIVVNNMPEHSIWSGARVDYTPVMPTINTIRKRLALIVSIMVCIIVVIVWRISSLADRFRLELVDSLRRLIEEDKPIRLRWKRPAEIRELGQALNSLSDRYLFMMNERRNAERQLKLLNRRLNMILENAAEGILELDKDGNISFANSAACEILGFAKEELIGNDLHSLVHYLRKDRSQYPAAECPFCSAVEHGEYRLFREDTFWKKNGEPVDVEYITAPIIEEDGNFAGMVMCIRDITERKKADRKADELQSQLVHSQKMEAVGTLAGGVAHDFNNLLTAITGYSELLARELEENPRARQQVQAIIDAARRASNLTRQLLAFSRKQRARKRIVDINELVREQLKMLRRLIGENIELHTELDEDEHLTVMADPGMIEQVIMNIVVNARDAMPEGGRITIRTARREIQSPDQDLYDGGRSGGFVCISVEDTGGGISQEHIKQIFNPFFTTKPVHKGTGLGLSVAWGIIEQHNGWINVYSEPEKGTVFNIYLPEFSGEGHKNSEEKLRSIDVSGKGRRILMLEDDSMVRNIAGEILSSYGFDVICAETIREAEEIFMREKETLHLVFSDVVLPDGNGVEFVKWVRQHVADMPVVLASGYTGKNSHVEEIRNMGLPFLQKPFHVHELVLTVDAAIKGKV